MDRFNERGVEYLTEEKKINISDWIVTVDNKTYIWDPFREHYYLYEPGYGIYVGGDRWIPENSEYYQSIINHYNTGKEISKNEEKPKALTVTTSFLLKNFDLETKTQEKPKRRTKRKDEGKYEILTCLECGKQFRWKIKGGQFPKYCSNKCRLRHYRKKKKKEEIERKKKLLYGD